MKKKKRGKSNNKFNKKIILMIFVLSLFFIGIGYSLLSEKIKITGKVKVYPKVEPKLDFDVETTIKDSWYSNQEYFYNIGLKIINNSNIDTTSWKINFDIPKDSKITQNWNLSYNIQAMKLNITNVSYNSIIRKNSSEEVGLILSSKSSSNFIPKNMILIIYTDISPNGTEIKIKDIQEPEVPDETNRMKVEFIKGNSWQENGKYAIQFKIKITNISVQKINSWEFSIGDINEILLKEYWNVNYILTNDKLKFSNVSYNGKLDPNASCEFGCTIISNKKDYIPLLLETKAN